MELSVRAPTAIMAPKRAPLADNPNAINSPLRATAATKRGRTAGLEARWQNHELDLPPAKKRMILEESTRNPLQKVPAVSTLSRGGLVQESRAGVVPSDNAFQRRLLASVEPRNRDAIQNRDQQQRQVVEKQRQPNNDNDKPRRADQEGIKVWREHYYKIFPKFVFYFESIPGETASSRVIKSISQLGAREEKFFSFNVTHVITTRTIPQAQSTSESSHSQSASVRQADAQSQSRTINPSLLEKHDSTQGQASQHKGRSAQELLAQGRPQAWMMNLDNRRQQVSQADVLVKAKDMGKKIWSFDKLDRILEALLAYDPEQGGAQVSRKAIQVTKQCNVEPDLSKLLQKEKQLPSDRLPWSDLVPLRNFYIYIHDMEEKMRPVMFREYKKRDKDADDDHLGDWPHLHATAEPRCPFVAESITSKGDETEKDPQAPTEQRKIPDSLLTARGNPSNGVNTHLSAATVKQPPAFDPPRQMLKPGHPDSRVSTTQTEQSQTTNQADTTDSLPPQNRFQFAGVSRLAGVREPLASGLQQSNQTSAIRSQVISSTANNPGARRATTKEMHDLKKRAFEQRRGLSTNITDVRAAINNPASIQGRTLQQKNATALDKIHEDEVFEDAVEKLSSKTKDVKKKASDDKSKPKSKPGYCENCREKYECFTEHIQERKHRAFAMKSENWTELDALLKQLARK